VIAPDSDKEIYESYRVRKAQDLKILVVKESFVLDCFAENSFLDVEHYQYAYNIDTSERKNKFTKGKVEGIINKLFYLFTILLISATITCKSDYFTGKII